MSEMRFDPMTGEPIKNDTVQVASFDSTGSMEYVPETKKKKGLLIGIIIAVAVILLAVAGIFAFMFFGGNPKATVTKACTKTFANLANGENKLLTALNIKEFAEMKEFTLSFDLEVENTWYEEKISCDGSMSKTADAIYLEGGLDLSDVENIPYLEGSFLWDSEKMAVGSPLLKNYFTYYYTQDVDGIISDYIEDNGIDVDDVNKYISKVYDIVFSDKNNLESVDELTKELKEIYDQMEIKKADSKTFTINDKESKCKGYTLIITEKDMEKFVDCYKGFMKNYYDESLNELLEEVSGESLEDAIDEMFEDFEDSIEDMDDIKINFYIYKGALAAIETKADGTKLSWVFQGGDYPAQNMTVKVDDNKLQISGSSDGDKETVKIKADGEEVLSYKFNSKTGALSIKALDGYNEVELEGITISNDGKEFSIDIEDLEIEDEYEINTKISLKSGASIEEMSGKEFNLNEASTADLMKLYEDEYSTLQDLGLF